MRFVRYREGAGLVLGVLDGQDVVAIDPALRAAGTLSEADATIVADTVPLIAAGERGLELAARAIEASRTTGTARKPLAGLSLAPPLRPEIILCSGENYWDHRDEKPPVDPKEPEFFIKVPHGAVGPEDDVLLDERVTKKLDYECELAVVIGRPGRHIPEARGLEHVFGYTVMNDCTARDRQVNMRPDGTSWYSVGPGKNFDTCAPMGPCIVTRDEIPDPQVLEVSTRVNGEIRQHNSTAQMIWNVPHLVQFFSTFLTLQPGFVIATGTPGGTAWGTDPELGGRPYERSDIARPSGYLRPGDVVECEIQGIGTLRNRIVLNA